METTKLFQPLSLGKLDLKHRVVMAPLTRLRCDRDHVPLPIAKEYYAQRASTPGSLIIAEATMPSLKHGFGDHTPGIWSDAQIKSWKEITDAIHDKGCFTFLQICLPGRAAAPGYDCLSSSAVPIDAQSRVPKEMDEAEILEAISVTVQASKNAIAAGFDGVELHGANGYLIDQFLQDNCNQRTDKWGGSVENRSRFALELSAAVAEAIGSERLGLRLSPWSEFQSMRMKEPVPQFSHLVQELKSYKLAYLHLIESRVNNWADKEKTEGIDFLIDIWNNQSPVLVAGGFKLDSAKNAVDSEYAKYDTAVVFGRYYLSTPDLVFRLKNGLEPNPYDRSTFYTPVQPEGYLDYPFSKEFESTVKSQA